MTSSLAVKIMTRLAMPQLKQRTCLWWRRKGKGGGKPNQTSWVHTMLGLWLHAARKQLWSRGEIGRGGEYGWSLAAGTKLSFLPPRSQSYFIEGLYVVSKIKKKMKRSMHRKVSLWITERSQQDSSAFYYMDIFPSRALNISCICIMIVNSWKAATQQMSAHRLFEQCLHLLQVSRGKGHEDNIH